MHVFVYPQEVKPLRLAHFKLIKLQKTNCSNSTINGLFFDNSSHTAENVHNNSVGGCGSTSFSRTRWIINQIFISINIFSLLSILQNGKVKTDTFSQEKLDYCIDIGIQILCSFSWSSLRGFCTLTGVYLRSGQPSWPALDAHACLYAVPQLMTQISVKKTTTRSKPLIPELRNCLQAQIWIRLHLLRFI